MSSLLRPPPTHDAEASLERLYRHHAADVYRFSLRVLRDPGDAEDATQTTFLSAFRALDQGKRPREPRAWLLAIARNVAIDHARVRRMEPIDPGTLLLETPDREAPPDERQIAADEAARLRDAIVTLPPEQRRALVLAAFLGRTAREIGTIEDAPLGTIKTRIRTAMLKLHTMLEVEDG